MCKKELETLEKFVERHLLKKDDRNDKYGLQGHARPLWDKIRPEDKAKWQVFKLKIIQTSTQGSKKKTLVDYPPTASGSCHYLIPLSEPVYSFSLVSLSHSEVLAMNGRGTAENTGDKVQQGNKRPPSPPSEMRTARRKWSLHRNPAITSLSQHSRHNSSL